MISKSISILLPALDEAETIGQVIRKIPKSVLAKHGYNVNIVVVDGHSKDMTCAIAKSLGAKLLTQRGFGKGDAIKTAFKNFDGKYLFMLDADNTYEPNDILKMLPVITDIIGYSKHYKHL